MAMIPVVISGGKGTRLWPLSRGTFPKPFCELLDETLMAKTLKRVSALGEAMVLTVEEQRTLTAKTLRDVGFGSAPIICEPFGRNTAASIALLCQTLSLKNQSDQIVGIFPADALIEKQTVFVEALKLAETCAQKNRVVTVGIKPTFPATGFGYIELSDQTTAESSSLRARRAIRFHEKPTLERAKEYVESGKFVWNAGMFVFRVSVMMELLAKWMPDLWTQMRQLKADGSNLKQIFNAIPSTSIDFGVMEHLKDQMDCVPCDLGWSDVGSWQEVAHILSTQKGDQKAEVISENSSNNFVFSTDETKVVGLVDVKDLVVVDTPDALLISHKESTQKVGQIVKALEAKKHRVANEHLFEYRPWGRFEIIRDDQRFKTKIIRVEAGQQFSYQSHAKRAEHWVVVDGEATVILNDKEHFLKKGDHILIPLGAKHRMRNDSHKPVEFIEVQTGSYFGEDDIVRYEDDYGRGN